MKSIESLKNQLKTGKAIKFKHEDYQFIVKANLKLENDNLKIDSVDVGLPKKALKREKLFLKLVNIYCHEVLCNNLERDIINSLPYKKVLAKLKGTNEDKKA